MRDAAGGAGPAALFQGQDPFDKVDAAAKKLGLDDCANDEESG